MNTDTLFPLAAGVMTLVLIVVAMRAFAIGGVQRPKVRATPLMTNVERQVINYIEEAVPHARVHAQVSMGAILSPIAGLSRSQATSIRNGFSSKRIDYVLEDRGSGGIIALVELDDRTHNSAKDARRDRLTATAGYITIRIPAGERRTRDIVVGRIREHLARTGGPLALC